MSDEPKTAPETSASGEIPKSAEATGQGQTETPPSSKPPPSSPASLVVVSPTEGIERFIGSGGVANKAAAALLMTLMAQTVSDSDRLRRELADCRELHEEVRKSDDKARSDVRVLKTQLRNERGERPLRSLAIALASFAVTGALAAPTQPVGAVLAILAVLFYGLGLYPHHSDPTSVQ